MICSAPRARPGTGDEHDGILVLAAADGGVKPGDDAVGLLALRDDVIEFEINPDRAYALSLRGIAREAAIAYGVDFHDPAHRELPGRRRRRLPGPASRTRTGCPVFVTRTVTGFDPSAPTPSLASPAGCSWPACGRSRWPSTSPTT